MENRLLEKFKAGLEEEKREITGELANIAIQSKKDPSGWKSKFTSSESETGHEARETASGESEEYGEQFQIAKNLAQKLADVDLALERIDKGTYGKCENCGQDIPIERLEAFPTASTCLGCDGGIGEL